MPSHQRVRDFIDTVVSGEHVRAIEDYYHPEASMQENGLPPREGRDTLVAHEKHTLSRVKHMHTHPVSTFLVDGDNVVVNWTFDAIGHDGSVRRLEAAVASDSIVKQRICRAGLMVRDAPSALLAMRVVERCAACSASS